jgi:sRNA-binding carbon storage regulator CsrA
MESSSLMLDLRPGESVAIGEDGGVRVQLIHKSGQLARLRVIAPRDLPIQKQQNDEVPSRAMRGRVRA